MMGGRESSLRSSRTHAQRVRILVAGCDPYRTTELELLVNKFIYNDYIQRHHTGIRIPIPFDPVTVLVNNIHVTLDIRDISATMHTQDDDFYSHSICQQLTQHPHVGVILLYNPTRKNSFEWVKTAVVFDLPCLLNEAKIATKVLPITIVGDECLLRGEREREVSYCMAKEFADIRGIPIIETYGKEGVNVELAFMTLVSEVLRVENLT